MERIRRLRNSSKVDRTYEDGALGASLLVAVLRIGTFTVAKSERRVFVISFKIDANTSHPPESPRRGASFFKIGYGDSMNGILYSQVTVSSQMKVSKKSRVDSSNPSEKSRCSKPAT
jgi:hypothetical protein